MSNNIDLKDIEMKAFMSYHKDGLIDVCTGFILLCYGIFIMADMPWLAAAGIALTVPFYAGIKEALVIPRLGMVKFSKDREAKESGKKLWFMAILLVFMAVLLLGAAILWITYRSDLFGAYFDRPLYEVIANNFKLITSTVIALALAAGALIFKAWRFLAYAALVFVSGLAGELAGIWDPALWTFALPGLLIMISGIVIVVTFVRNNPVIGNEA